MAALSMLMVPLSACAADEPEPEKLSASQAGGVYLDAVCPVNTAWDVVDVELDRLRTQLARGDEDSTAIEEALAQLGDASAAAAEALDATTHEWPREAAGPVESVRETLIADRKQAAALAKRPAADIAEYSWEGGTEAGAAAAEARAALGLPEDPVFACTEWAAQHEKKSNEETSGEGEEGSAPTATPAPTTPEKDKNRD